MTSSLKHIQISIHILDISDLQNGYTETKLWEV